MAHGVVEQVGHHLGDAVAVDQADDVLARHLDGHAAIRRGRALRPDRALGYLAEVVRGEQQLEPVLVDAETSSGDRSIGIRTDPQASRVLRARAGSGDVSVLYGG